MTKEVMKREESEITTTLGAELLPNYGVIDLTEVGKCPYLYDQVGGKKKTIVVLKVGLRYGWPYGLYPYPMPKDTVMDRQVLLLGVFTADIDSLRLRFTEVQAVRKSGSVNNKRSTRDFLEASTPGAVMQVWTAGEGDKKHLEVDEALSDDVKLRAKETYELLKGVIKGVKFNAPGAPLWKLVEPTKPTAVMEEE